MNTPRFLLPLLHRKTRGRDIAAGRVRTSWQNAFRSLCRLVRRTLACLGLLALLLLVLQFTSLPWRAILALSRSPHASADLPSPDAPTPASAILLFSGSGVPSESALMRIHYAAALAARYPTVPLWLAVPDTPATAPQVRAYLDELARRGVDPARVKILGRGDSTATQAAEAAALLPPTSSQPPVLIVTTPYHIRRAVRRRHFGPRLRGASGRLPRSVGTHRFRNAPF
ncbi:MAG: YdcF family protein, partial [Kiritimatiellae bacterium]|nr:YdcF family protein [Kiritimatiellia bacterium]